MSNIVDYLFFQKSIRIIMTVIIIAFVILLFMCVYYYKYKNKKIEKYNDEFKIGEINESNEEELINGINKSIVIEKRIVDEIEEHKYTDISILTSVSLLISTLGLLNSILEPFFKENITEEQSVFLEGTGLLFVIGILLTIFAFTKDTAKSIFYRKIRMDLKERLKKIRYQKSEMNTKLYLNINKNLQNNNDKKPNIIKRSLEIVATFLKS